MVTRSPRLSAARRATLSTASSEHYMHIANIRGLGEESRRGLSDSYSDPGGR